MLVSLYSVDRAGVADVVSGLLTTEQLRVESAELVWRAKRLTVWMLQTRPDLLHQRSALYALGALSLHAAFPGFLFSISAWARTTLKQLAPGDRSLFGSNTAKPTIARILSVRASIKFPT